MKVVYVAGYGRNGSTVLGQLLAEVPGWVSVGELRRLFQPGVTCGCGELAGECPFWRSVVDDVESVQGRVDRDRFRATLLRAAAPRKVPGVLQHGPVGESAYHAAVMGSLRRAVAAEAGAEVVVDSSKDPAGAALLARDPDAVVVHLVRDPRATVFSWSRRRRVGQEAVGAARSAARWFEWNVLTEMVVRRLPPSRTLRLRYEDFVGAGQATVQSLVDRVGPCVVPPLEDRGRMVTGTNHMLHGHPGRFRSGEVPLSLDDAWRDHMSSLEERLIAAATWPLMVRYGYAGGGAGRHGEAQDGARDEPSRARWVRPGRLRW